MDRRLYISITVVLLITTTGCSMFNSSSESKKSWDISISNINNKKEIVNTVIEQKSSGNQVLKNTTTLTPDEEIEYYKLEDGNEYIVTVSTNSGKKKTIEYAHSGSSSLIITIDEEGISETSATA